MSKTVICYKWVLDEADIRVDSDFSINLSKAKYKISDYDKNTIEAGSKAAKALGSTSVGLSCGGLETKKSFPDALARGLDEGVWLNTGDTELCSSDVVAMLASAIKNMDDVKLILCSDGSSDEYSRSTGPRLDAALDIPVITSIVSFDVFDNYIIAVKKADNCMQTIKVDLPCVAVVLPEIGPAPIPGLKQVMAAKKKTVTEINLNGISGGGNATIKRDELKGFVSNRKNTILKGNSDEESVKLLVNALRKEGIL